MPTLPSISITDQAVWDRVFAAFDGSAPEYRNWLVRALREEVQRREAAIVMRQADISIRNKVDQLNTQLAPENVTFTSPRGGNVLKEPPKEEEDK